MKTRFEPIAIVGRGCVLPGALNPEQLWNLVEAEEDALEDVPEGYWGMDADAITTDATSAEPEKTWTQRGGYVRRFAEVFERSGLQVPPQKTEGLDALFEWGLYAVRQAMESAEMDVGRSRPRAGLILGNKSYPTHSMCDLAEGVWRRSNGWSPTAEVDRRNRFMSGYSARFIADAVGLEGDSFCLDVACSSSLYAIKLACDRLHRREADVMVAGGINRADNLLLHVGFCSLKAMSKTGRSRPFHRHADGLVPAEGAAVVVLKRLSDAVEANDVVLGVIRGVGLSNDGRSRGLLTPSSKGQVRSIERAYRGTELSPSDLSLVECHAAGTPLGDATEIRSMIRAIGDDAQQIAVGSLKSNLGHLITASGAAGLLKVLGAMEHGIKPATLHAEEVIDELQDGPLRPLHRAEPWECDGVRRAAINNFGFGGNNAHLVVEEYVPQPGGAAAGADLDGGSREEIAVTALEVIAADGTRRDDFARDLLSGRSRVRDTDDGPQGRAERVDLDIAEVRFPPADLEKALPQQLMILRSVLGLKDRIEELPADTTGVLIGMQCDVETSRYMVRWRLREDLDEEERDGVIGAVDSAAVLGTMPNVVTNRINSQFDLRGASLTVSDEELSGLRALELACEALNRGELDAAVVGAVDLSCEPVHREAASQLLDDRRGIPGDAAVAMILKRLDDARADGDEVLAIVPGDDDDDPTANGGEVWEVPDLTTRFGHAHAASGLLRVAAGVEAVARRALPADQHRPVRPWLFDEGRRQANVSMASFTGGDFSITVCSDDGPAVKRCVDGEVPRLDVYAADDPEGLADAVESGQRDGEGSWRLSIVSRNSRERAERHEQALVSMRQVKEPAYFEQLQRGVYLGNGAPPGETAFVFTGPAGSYRGMGRNLVMALPELADAVAERARCMKSCSGWIYEPDDGTTPGPGAKLWGSVYLCQIHAQLTRRILKMKPQAAIGFCGGETNALYAMGAWDDFDGLYEELKTSGIFTRHISGRFEVLQKEFGLSEEEADWETWRLLAPVEVVEEAIHGEDLCYVTIINAPGDLILGGLPDACRRVIDRVGERYARPLGFNIAMHCPAMRPAEKLWYEMHHRPTTPVEGVRFYTHSTLDSYEVDADRAARALVGQAMGQVNFPKLVERAWEDGVRIFIEHGPRSGCSRWISKILGERDHLSVPLDRTGVDSLLQAVDTTARLWAAGVDVDFGELRRLLSDVERIDEMGASTEEEGVMLRSFDAHLPPVRLSPKSAKPNGAEPVTLLPRAPHLPSVLGDGFGEPAPQKPTVVSPHPETSGARSAISTSKKEDRRPVATTRSQKIAQALAEAGTEAAQVQRQFLAQRQRWEQWLVRMASGNSGVGARAALDTAMTGSTENASVAAPPFEPQPTHDSTNGSTHDSTNRSTHDSANGSADTPVSFGRRELEIHASGKISQIFGPLFKQQDENPRQVRMPEPPLLLVDRVTGIDAEPGAMKNEGTIWTETDVRADAWYMHRGRMPTGIMVESGQADLMLISYMGADFENRNERVYRLLGCVQTFHGELPRPGETLRYEIQIDEHVCHGPVRLFFFHYDCTVDGELRLSVRHGQAGFFTDEELANSEGVIWSPEDLEPPTEPTAEPVVLPRQSRFGAEEIRAFAAGGVYECFGAGFERGACHTDTPRIEEGRMLLFDEVECFDPVGGPHGRGYLRAVQEIRPDTWFFDGHFKNDPCMPGTLMLQACTQVMAFYLTATGFTLSRDGWRFEPVRDEPFTMRCRGQVTPQSKKVVYELFVREIVDGQTVAIYADLMCTVDGLKAFHCERLGLEIVPDWPLEWHPEWMEEVRALSHGEGRPVAEVEGFRYDLNSIMACTMGRPTDAFGPTFAPFDGPIRTPRLPGPPYLFISRIAHVDGLPWSMKEGSRVVAEYDVPDEVWYFQQSWSGAMPFAVLKEVGLQPCGWLASYVGCSFHADYELCFRNLDGTGTVYREVTPATEFLRTEATLKAISRTGAMTIVKFDVEIYADDELAFRCDTAFGAFPGEALEDQVGLAVSQEQRRRRDEPTERETTVTMVGERNSLTMFDEITGWWPEGGASGLGRIRSEQEVDPAAWYFKAHFFQDPVQPGSLGIQAMIQMLQTWMSLEEMDAHLSNPRFEPIMCGSSLTWKYRGQVVPETKKVVIDLEITECSQPGAHEPYAIAKASLWADDIRIYELSGLGVQIQSEGVDDPEDDVVMEVEEVIEPDVDVWVLDHRPTFTVPALPMMSVADMMARAVVECGGGPPTQIVDLQMLGWATIEGPTSFCSRVRKNGVDSYEVEIYSRGRPVAKGRFQCGRRRPAPEPLMDFEGGEALEDPYGTGELFHGPSFHLLERGRRDVGRARGVLDAGSGSVPTGLLHPALLDAALHLIPHGALERWSDDVDAGMAAYPNRIDRLSIYGKAPGDGEVTAVVELVGVERERFVHFRVQLRCGEELWADMDLVETLLPYGRLGRGEPGERRSFLRDREYVEGFGISRSEEGATRLSVREVRRNDWLEGTVARVYGVTGDLKEMTRQIAVKDHVGQKLGVHPSRIEVDEHRAYVEGRPGEGFEVTVSWDGSQEVIVH